MNLRLRNKLIDVLMGTLAIAVGVVINALGDRWTGVHLVFFGGIESFNYNWAITLFLVPLVAGIPVALIYGFGGKLLAMFVPLILQSYNYMQSYNGNVTTPEGYILLPFIYWVLVVVIAMELCAAGGVLGEVIVKRTYGRSPKNRQYPADGTVPEGVPVMHMAASAHPAPAALVHPCTSEVQVPQEAGSRERLVRDSSGTER